MLDATPAIGAAPLEIEGIALEEAHDLTIISLAASPPPTTWPEPGHASERGDGQLIRLGPDQCFWLGTGYPELEEGIYTTDQSDSWAVVDIAGPATHAVLERLCPLDLETWQVGQAGRTIIEHLAAIIVKTDADAFRMLSPRSSADDFWHALATTVNDRE